MNTLHALKLTSTRGCQAIEIENTLKSLQREVRGFIEIPYLCDKLLDLGIDTIINEEGKLQAMEPTLVLLKDGNVADVIYGPILFTSHDDEGNTVSLNTTQCDYLLDTIFSPKSVVLHIDGELKVLKYLDI